MIRRMRTSLVLALILATACGTTGAPSVSAPSSAMSEAAASPTASPLPSPSRLPGSSVRVSVNGVDQPFGSTITVSGDGPTVVVLGFPFDVDRASVERWLPRSASLEWPDDRTLRVRFPESESYPGFKVPETRSRDGTAVVDLFVVNVRYPPSAVLSVHTVAQLEAGATVPTTRISLKGTVKVSPDATRLLTYDGYDGPTYGRPGAPPIPIQVVELFTKKSATLDAPPLSEGPFSFGGWLPDGRVVLVGSKIWIGPADGSALKAIANATDPSGARARIAQASPRGRSLAFATPSVVGIVDLTSGAVRFLAQPKRSCDSGPYRTPGNLAWSSDERLLAWIDCGADGTTANARVRIVDVAADRTVRLIEGGANSVAPQLSGDLVIYRDSGEQGAGARGLFVVLDFNGVEQARRLAYSHELSPDGRYLLQIATCCAGQPNSSLTDLATPSAQPIPLPGVGTWIADGRVLVWRP